MAPLLFVSNNPKPGPHAGWTETELGAIIILAGLLVMFIAAILIQSRKRPR